MKPKLAFAVVFSLVFCVSVYGVQLSVPEVTAEPGSMITVEIIIDDATGLASGDLVLWYDPAILEAKEVRTTDLTAGFLIASNLDVPGEITIAMAAFPGIAEGNGAILEVDFEVKADGPDSTSLTLSDVVLFNELSEVMDVTTVDGSVAVEAEQPPGPPVVREHTSGSLFLALESTYDEANVHEYTYVDIWSGEMPIETGMFLEFQVAMFSGNPTFKGTIDLHTTDGSTLGDSGAMDQNGLSANPNTDLSEYARDRWYHRMISLDALAGKTLDGVMIATDSDEHSAGPFRLYADNIQITDGEYILMSIYAGEETIPITGEPTATGTTFAGVQGMSDYLASVVGATPVLPAGKLIASWGKIKNGN